MHLRLFPVVRRAGRFAILLMGIFLHGFLFAQSFTASVNKNPVGAGQQFQYSIEMKDMQGRDLRYPDFKAVGLTLLQGPFQSQNMTSTNGRMSSSLTYTFALSAPKDGTYTIPAAVITTAGGKQMTAKPISLTVTKQAAAGNGQQQGGVKTDDDLRADIAKDLFVKAVPTKTTLWQGEQVSITYKLFTRANLAGLEMGEAPRYEGFWAESIAISQAQYQVENVNGQQYQAAVIKKDVLFPQKSGALTVSPLKLKSVVRVVVQRQQQSRRSLFDDFFADPFSNNFDPYGNRGVYKDIAFTFAAPAVPITVKPLPVQGKPASFTGAVGKYTCEISTDKETVTTGDAVTVRIRVKGEGNLKTLAALDLTLPDDFVVYDPEIAESSTMQDGTLQGERTYEYLVVPQKPGDFDLSLPDFSYFDPAKGQYVTIPAPKKSLHVDGGAIVVGREAAASEAASAQAPAEGGIWKYLTLTLLGLVAAGVGGWFLWGRWKRRQSSTAEDTAASRQRAANGVARKRLAAAKQHLDAANEKAFYNETMRAIYGYVGDKFGIPVSELSHEVIRTRLASLADGQSLGERISELAATCEMALFAPAAAGMDAPGVYNEAVAVIAEIEAPKKG